MTFKSRIGKVLIPLLPINRRTFDILRYEGNAILTRLVNSLNPFFHLKVGRLRKQSNLSVNVGSGGRGLPDWVNVEMIRMRDTTLCLDIRRPLPLADGSVIRLLAEQVVEHVDFVHDIPGIFKDWHRVLATGGTVRIIVPDARRYIEAYLSNDNRLWQALGWDMNELPHDIYTPMHVINHTFHQSGEHLFGYDFETMSWALRQAGFRKITQMKYLHSHDPLLAIDQANHQKNSLYVEAVKE